MDHALTRKAGAEFTGTAVLVAAVVGSGIMATNLTQDAALALLINAASTVCGLSVLIWLLAPVSGAHFNPAVTLAALRRGAVTRGTALTYSLAQTVGAIAGALLANGMFGGGVLQVSHHARTGVGLYLGEIVATAGLVAVVFSLGAEARPGAGHVIVPVWIGSAYFFTASTSFANPAVTIGRIFTDSFAGIAPGSVPAFVVAQAIGGAIGLTLARAFDASSTTTRH